MRNGIVHHKSDRKSCVIPTADCNTIDIHSLTFLPPQSKTNTFYVWGLLGPQRRSLTRLMILGCFWKIIIIFRMSPENRYFGGPGSDQTRDMLLGLPYIHHEPSCKECTFLIDHRVVEEYLKYCCLLADGFCKIHVYIPLGSQKTPESGRKVNNMLGTKYDHFMQICTGKSILEKCNIVWDWLFLSVRLLSLTL